MCPQGMSAVALPTVHPIHPNSLPAPERGNFQHLPDPYLAQPPSTPRSPSSHGTSSMKHKAFAAMTALGCSLMLLGTTPALATDSEVESTSAPVSTGLSKGEIKAQRDFKLLDFNGDGKLSRSEVRLFPRLAQAFDSADTDGDSYVSYDEVKAFALIYRAERARLRAAQSEANRTATTR